MGYGEAQPGHTERSTPFASGAQAVLCPSGFPCLRHHVACMSPTWRKITQDEGVFCYDKIISPEMPHALLWIISRGGLYSKPSRRLIACDPKGLPRPLGTYAQGGGFEIN